MALSGSIDYNDTFAECLKDALILIGGLEDNESPAYYQEQQGMRWANRLLKSWQPHGFKLWTLKEGELALCKGENTYTIGIGGDYNIDRPQEISNVRRYIKDDNNEVPIPHVARSEYTDQTLKSSQGKPILCNYDPQLTNGIVRVWPTPDDSQDELRFTYRAPIQDIDASTDNIDLPPEWLLAFTYNMALLLCPQYEVDFNERGWIRQEAMRYLEDAMIGDDDKTSLKLAKGFGQ